MNQVSVRPKITLLGCAPVPLAHYLKALGVLRLVSEQVDSTTTGWWERETFHLSSSLDTFGLSQFFLQEYRPTPLSSPWNNDGGFFASSRKTARATLQQIEQSTALRLEPYRITIAAHRKAISMCQLDEAPDGERKGNLLTACRALLPDLALGWMDAALVLTEFGPKYPPLLGSGGNDGSLDFSKNFLLRLLDVLDPSSGKPTAAAAVWLRQALYAENAPGAATQGPVGQFFPGAAGGANSTSGFGGVPAVNPWDYIFMLEGAVLFAAASVKKLDSSNGGNLSWPFAVRATGVGYGSASLADEVDGKNFNEELWLPLWSKSTTLPELEAIIGEGRAQVRGRAARTGLDFAAAVVTLGVDRGITAFQRYGFLTRNGLSTFATPLERVIVRRNARADLLAKIDGWLDRLRSKARPQANPPAPASVRRALTGLEARILDLCKNDDRSHVQSVLVELGRAERALARSLRWTTSDSVRLRPLDGLSSRWLREADTGQVEFRLAAALAGTYGNYGGNWLPLRKHLEPVEIGRPKSGQGINWIKVTSNDVVYHEGDLVGALNAIFERRLLHATEAGERGFPDRSPRPARLDDVAAFIDRRIDDTLLANLIWGLSLVDWPAIGPSEEATRATEPQFAPSSLYALLRLCYCQPRKDEEPIPIVAAIHQRAMQGDGAAASELAVRRLRGCGLVPAITHIPMAGENARRTAAALLFPIHFGDFSTLKKSILRQT